MDLLDRLFTAARSQNGWIDQPVNDDQLREAYELAKWGPTSLNSQPMRIVFLRSVEAKMRLKPALAEANVSKVMTAPVVAILAYDTEFHSELPTLFPHAPHVGRMFDGKTAFAETTAFRNASLQAAYFMMAVRAVGLDVGPLSGFDAAKVNEEFFKTSTLKVNFICGIGQGDAVKVYDRLPRLAFDRMATIL